MIIAHRNPAYHARRAAIWAMLAAVPWAILAFSGDTSDLGRGWGGAALISPIALALAARELWRALAGKSRAVWTDGDMIASDRFRKPRSDLVNVRAERHRPRYGMWEEQFIVLEFSNGPAVRMLSKRLFEAQDDIVHAISALKR
ncbi:hypothetical protein [Brevundimonas subvibrioides]|uniref:hypothetical protein n=1 Tax=Brevundimonas subvibrioides TaxID=74313 RepID=UPI0032D5A3A8